MLFARERATMSFDEWLDRRIHHTELDALIDLSGAGLKIGMLPSRVLPWRGRNFAGDARTSPVREENRRLKGIVADQTLDRHIILHESYQKRSKTSIAPAVDSQQ